MIKYKNIYLTGDLPLSLAYKWRNNPSIYKFCRQHTLISPQDHNSYLNNINNSSSNVKLFGIKSEDKEYIGVCGFTSMEHINRTGEFSLYIAPQYQGKGYAKNIMLALMKVGFNDLNFNRIWGEVFETNNKALNLFYSLGFTKEGELRDSYYKNGRYINSIIISQLKKEYDLFINE